MNRRSSLTHHPVVVVVVLVHFYFQVYFKLAVKQCSLAALPSPWPSLEVKFCRFIFRFFDGFLCARPRCIKKYIILHFAQQPSLIGRRFLNSSIFDDICFLSSIKKKKKKNSEKGSWFSARTFVARPST